MSLVSCFFCQSALSDYLEGLLPSLRHDVLKRHLGDCPQCRKAHQELSASLKVLNELPSHPMSQEIVLQITEASLTGREALFSRGRLSRVLMTLAVFLLISGGVIASFPQLFPWFYEWRAVNDDSHFVRYFPLFQGASEIVEEQAAWFHVKEPFSRSVWEEGGLSPEEFEKTFQGKGSEKSISGELSPGEKK